jgi:hypothetical protein
MTYYLYYQERKEYEKCSIKTTGIVKGFSLRSNKIVEVKIEYIKENLPYTVFATATSHLRSCFYSKEKKCIGQKCIVYYACSDPRIISYELIEKDSLISK